MARGRQVAAARAEVRATSPAQLLLPSGRSLAVGFGLLATALLLFLSARETAVFSVRSIDVVSEPAGHAGDVRRTLAPIQGTSLLKVDQDLVARRLENLPHVHVLGFDRSFPNGLRVHVSVERAVAVLRRGEENWLVSGEGRVLRKLERRLRRPLPVVWVPRAFEPEIGALLRTDEQARAVAALAEASVGAPRFARTIWYVKRGEHGLTIVLRDRRELRLGNATDLTLKLRVAQEVLASLRASGSPAAYIDVAVPDRPVAGATLDSQVEP
ncbi:MAG: cell division protein FtsQ/DivIB [Gaiellales bacterium]